MSFKYHEPCPNCGSRDNRAVYDDGHTWCFGCGTWTPPDSMSLNYIDNYLKKVQSNSVGVQLPEDFTLKIPKDAYSWIKQYEITNEELIKNNIGWSASRGMLIFPYYGEKDDLQMWQGRYFPARKPKVFTDGRPENFILLPHEFNPSKYSERVVVVEDPVSAIKVNREVPCSPLMGANLSIDKAVRLSKLFKHLTIWLDFDKLKSMVSFTEKYRSLYEHIDYVVTEKDPKELSDKEIKENLNE